MKISYNWLKEYVDIDMDPVELGKILTNTGLEVEGIETFESLPGGLKDVVLGKVLTCSKHPDADKLSLTTVDIGEEEAVQIVCGAPNVAEGQTVAVAKIGATLYPAGSDEGFMIKKAKIRGQESYGMICAEDELGLGSNHEGIMVLDDNAPAGMPASDYFHIEHDTVFEIGLTPNRIDGASHIGVARDVVAYLKQQGKPSILKIPSNDTYEKDNDDLNLEVSVENPEACPRYSGVCLTNLQVSDSPEWLQNRLKAIGQTPINNVVDITNYILHETGQPLHAFDAEKIEGKKVLVKTLPAGTRFTTLDEKERELSDKDLMICNEKEGMCIGGVFGGLKSGVTGETKAIFLESACFDPVFIRKTAKLHQLNTDASFRFERGTDPNGTVYALKRAALLMKEIAGAKIASEITDIYPEPVKDFRVEVSFKNIYRLIGKEIPAEEIVSILESLDIQAEQKDDRGMILQVPPYRVDVQREADIVEEILRIYGYNNIDFNEHVNSTLSYVKKPDREKLLNTLSDLLSANGFMEIKSNSLTKESYFDEDDTHVVEIYNPLSQDLSRMRTSLLQGGLEAIAYNINRKRANLKLYEYGNVYSVNPDKKSDHPLRKYSEQSAFALFVTGLNEEANWTGEGGENSFYRLKAYVSMIFQKAGIILEKTSFEEHSNSFYTQALNYSSGNKLLLTIGKVDENYLKNFDIKQDVFAAEINWDLFINLHSKHHIVFQPLPKFPEVKRDLSLMLAKNIRFEELRQIAYKTESRILRNVELFDVYEGDKIEKGKKSYALSFILRDDEKTLTDKQIDKIMNRISTAFEKQLGAVVRGA